ncbi:YppG family protein, partial [Bacillus pumilus]|uniref:YppG family protein n=1 Tax=Bacillus pumilus TaxID=1408 RepID=UPI0021B44CE1
MNQSHIQPPPIIPIHHPINPYPFPTPQKHQSSQFKTLLSQFKKTNPQFHFNKIFHTPRQIITTINQLSSLAKGFTTIFK